MNRKRIAAIIATATIVGGIYINPVIAHADNINNVANIKVQEQNNSNITNNIDAYDQASYISLNNITFTSDKDISGKYLYVEVEGYGQVTVGEIKTTMIDGVKHYIVPKAENGNDIPVNKPLNVKFYIANSQFKQFDLSKCTLAYEAKGVEFHALDVFKMNIKSGLPEEYNGKNVYYSLNPLSTTSQVNEIKKLKQVKIGKDGTVNVYTNSQSAGDIYFYVKNKEGKFTRYFAQYLPGVVNYTIKKLDYYQDAGNGTYVTSKMPSSFVCPENQAWVVMGNGMININLTPGQIPDSSKIKTTISIEGLDNKVIGTPESATGEPGNKTNLKTPEIPEGYHLVNITDNGKVITNVPNTFGDSNDNIIYHVAKNPKITVKVVDSKGKELGNSEVVTGDPSSKVTAKVPSIPEGYHLVNVTNGEGEIVNGIPSTFGDKDETIIYHVEKNPTKTTISIEGSDDKVIGTPESATGEPGNKTNLKTPEIPEGYHLVNITDNGKVITNVPNTFGDSNDNIIYHVAKNPKITVKVVDSKGKELGNSEVVTGDPSSKVTAKVPSIPEGYHLVNVTNGEGEIVNGIPSTFGDKDETIIYHVEKNPTKTTISIEGSDDKVIGTPESATGEPGNKTNLKTPEIPEGYHLVNITDNGKVITNVPNTFGDSNDNIIYHVAKNPKITVKVVDSKGKELGNSEVVTGDPSSKVTAKVPSIPEGYHLVNVTNGEGEIVNGIPSTFGDKDETIIYHVEKNPTKTTISIEGSDDKVIGTPESATGEPGNKTNLKTPEIPEGYHLVNITDNGKVITNVPNTFGDSNDNIIYHVAKNPKITVKVVDSKGKELGNSEVVTGDPSSKVTAKVPSIPEGYHLVNVTNGEGEIVNGIPSTFGDKDETIIYHVEKNPTKTTISIEGSDDKVIGTPESATGEPGNKTNLKTPEIPEGYHLVNITDNGKVITNVPNTFGDSNDNIIYHVAKNPKITVKVVDSKGKELGNSEVVTGDPSSKVTAKVPSIPEGYHLVNVTNGEGEIVNGIPSTFGDKDETIIYHVEKNPTKTTISIEGSDDKVIGIPESATGEPGNKTNLKTPEIPNGYHLVNITDNGKVITKVPSTFGDSDNNIIYHVAKNPKITVKVVDAKGKELGKSEVVTGDPSSQVIAKVPSIPEGYHLVNVTNGEGKTVNGIPSTFGDKDEIIIYHVEKNPTKTTISIEGSNGKAIETPESATGEPGDKTNLKTSEIPNGYHLVNITDNGKVITKVPSTFGDSDNNIIYHVAKNPKITVKVIDSKGKELGKSEVVTGDPSSKVIAKVPSIPKGYHLVNVTNGEGKIVNGIPSTFGDKDENIIYHVEKNPTKTTISIEGSDNKVIGTPESATGEPGDKTNLKTPEIPEGYHLVNITDNGKVITKIPNTFGDKDETVIYHVEKNPTKTTISIEGSDNKVIGTPESATGEPGDKINLKTPEIPNGYHLVNITDNGKVITNVPNTFGDSDNNIIYHVAKNPNITVKVVDSKGKELGNSEVVTGDPSSKVTAKVPSIPEGYHLVNVTNGEGKIVNGIPSTFGDKDETIIYHVEKNPTKTTISIEGSDNKVIGTPESATGEPGDKTNLKTPEIPEGYHLVNITDNGKVITKIPNTFGDKDETVIYHVEKNPTKTTISIEGSDNKVIGTPESATGEPGDKINLKTPEIPNGYHLVNITDNGKVITNVPNTFGDSDNNIIYHVAKNPNITVKVVDSKGKELGNSEVVTGDPSSKVIAKVPSIPEGYHLVNVTNGEGEIVNGIPSTFGDKDEIIIYHVEKNPTKTTISIEGSDNKVIGTPESATGEPGNKTNLKTPEIPEGYHLVNITDNGKVITKIPNTFGDSDYNIIYHVAKNPNITIKVIDANGKEIGTPKVVTGTPNAKVTVKTPSIPSGYHLVKVTNGEGQTVNGIPSIFGNENETIEYHIAKDIKNNSNRSGVKNIKVSIENEDGESIGIPRVISGISGEKANVPVPTIPKGYKLDSITINGVKVNKMPTTFGDVNGSVVYHVSKVESSENPKTGDSSNIPEVAGILGSLALLLGINLKKKNPVTK